jgi:hypothetical protein
MSLVPPPKIDRRTYTDIVRLLLQEPLEIDGVAYQGLRERFTPEWQAHLQTDVLKVQRHRDVGAAMVHIFARLMEILIERLNRVPDKHLIAFLDMLGIERLPGNPARVPVSFIPAPKSPPGRFVPQGTQVATTQTEQANAIIFETEEGFDLTVVTLDKVFTIDPAADRYRDLSAAFPCKAGAWEPILRATDQDDLTEHSLYMAHDTIFSGKDPLDLRLTFDIAKGAPTPLLVSWERYDGKGWAPVIGDPSKIQDGTDGFKDPGTITIPGFQGTEPFTLESQTAYWIRCKLDSPLTMALIDLPEIDRISVGLSVPQGRVLVPDGAFFNTLPIDLNRDFYPFGERPNINDCFYISCEEAFALPDLAMSKKITVEAALSPIPGKPQGEEYPDTDNITLAWEYWNKGTQAWEEIGESSKTKTHGTSTSETLVDTTVCFTEPSKGSVVFDLPSQIGKVTVNGVEAHWIRVRIVGGNYGVEASVSFAFEDDKITRYTYTPATFKPPFLSVTDFRLACAIRLKGPPFALSACKGVNHFRMVDHSAQSRITGQTFVPFTPLSQQEEWSPALYLGYSDAFGNRRISQFFDLESTIEIGENTNHGHGAEPQMVWEYMGTSGAWRRLDVTDGTQNLTNPGTVVFTAPADMGKTSKFGFTKNWLRARLGAGILEAPRRLKAIYPNTMWARNLRTIQNEILGSGTGQSSQAFKLSQAPVLLGERLLIREANAPSTEEESALRGEEAALGRRLGTETRDVVVRRADVLSGQEEIWVRWYPVSHFLGSFPNSRHYLIDRVTGEITFGDGERGMLPPIGKDNIKAEWYQAGGGAEANRAATTGAVKELKSSLPFVSKVTNYVPATGGSDSESMKSVKERGPQTLKHRNRAVTVEDFDWLVREASTRIALVKTLPTTNRKGKPELGAITVVIVPQSHDPKPVPSPELIDQVRNYLRSRGSETITHRIDVVGPRYVKVSVFAQVVPLKPEEASVVEGRAIKALEAFLHPLTGGPDSTGWPFGRSAYISEIYAVIEATAGVDYVLKARFLDSDDPTVVPVGPNELVYSGTHQIVMGPEGTTEVPIPPKSEIRGVGEAAFLGNAGSGEVHDLMNQKPACNISRILPHHRIQFSSLSEALQKGFDPCGHCIGSRKP